MAVLVESPTMVDHVARDQGAFVGSVSSLLLGVYTQGQFRGPRSGWDQVGVESGCQVRASSVKAWTTEFSDRLVSTNKLLSTLRILIWHFPIQYIPI